MDAIFQELNHAMLPSTAFELNLFGYTIPITDTVVTMWLIMTFLIISSYILGRKLELVPSKTQNVGEVVVEGINNFVKDVIGNHWKAFAPYLGTVLLFLAFANTIAIFNIFPNWKEIAAYTGINSLASLPSMHLRPPTKDINVTASLALMSIILVIGASIKYRKVSGFTKSFFEPMPFLFPLKVIELSVKPLSLSLRLFGNILAAFTLMELIYLLAKAFSLYVLPSVVPSIFSMYFDIFDGLLQAYIFTLLTSLYISEGIEEDH